MIFIRLFSRDTRVSMPSERRLRGWQKIRITAIRITGLGLECSHKTDYRHFLQRSNLMTKLNRRSVLTGLATVPLVSGPFFGLESASAQVGHAAGTRWLYVNIHGAYIAEFQPSGVRLLLPKVFDGTGKFAHEYRAGYLLNGEGTPLDPVSPVALIGFPGATSAPQIDKATIPCIDNVPLVATSNLYCGAVLPFPDAVVPLRQIPQAGDKTAFFNLTELKDLKWLPLLLQFQYELQPGDRPALVGTGGSWKDDGRNPLILHFRA